MLRDWYFCLIDIKKCMIILVYTICRWNHQLEDILNNGFKSLSIEIGLLKQNLDKMGSRVDNLSTSINILTNMQSLLVEKIVDNKIKDNYTKVLGCRANSPLRCAKGSKGTRKV